MAFKPSTGQLPQDAQPKKGFFSSLFGASQPAQPVQYGAPVRQPASVSQTQATAATVASEVLSAGSELEAERIFREGVVTIKDIIAPSAMQVNSEFLRLGELFVRTMYVTTYPRYISIGWFTPIMNLNATMDIGMFFYPVDSDVILKQLKKKVGALEAQIFSDSDKGAARDPLRETALHDIELLRDQLTQGTEHFFQFALYVTLYTKTKDDLDRLSERVEAIFSERLIYVKRAYFQSEQGFNSTLPVLNDEIMVAFNMNTSPIASSFPFTSSELTSDQGILYGVNRHNNSLILFDRFSLQNANMVVFATSGAGKSYAVKLEVLRTLMMGHDVIVIDPEMEYKHLCDAVGGTYINISLSSESKINPFDLPRKLSESSTTEDIIRSAVITTKGLMRLVFGGLTTEEDAIVDRALIETYAKKDIVAGVALENIKEVPIMQDFQEVLEGMTGTENLVTRVKKYTEGTFSGLFNSPTTVDIKNQLVIFSVRDLEDELRPLAIYSIVNYIWNVVRSELKRRVLVIDEAWWLMQHEDSARFIFALVKRCRKYYLGITTISQDVKDFLSSTYGQAIITNSALQLLLRQSPAAIDVVKQTFLLTEGEKRLLLQGAVGEGIFFAGNKHAAIKIFASYNEDQLITTNPEQLLAIQREKQEFEEQLAGQEQTVAAPEAASQAAPVSQNAPPSSQTT